MQTIFSYLKQGALFTRSSKNVQLALNIFIFKYMLLQHYKINFR